MCKAPGSSARSRKRFRPTRSITDDSRKEHGLKGEYFANLELKDAPVMTRTDATVDFAWGDTGINHDLPNNYSVRWTGVLVPPESGEFTVGFLGQDGWRLWLDGNLVGEDWNVHHPATIETKTLPLEKDHAYAVKIEYYQTIRSAEARFVWSLPGGQTQEAVDAAAKSDLVVMVLGLSQRIEGEEMKVNAEGFRQRRPHQARSCRCHNSSCWKKFMPRESRSCLSLINGSAMSRELGRRTSCPRLSKPGIPARKAGTRLPKRSLVISVQLAVCRSRFTNRSISFRRSKTTRWPNARTAILTASRCTRSAMA